MKFCSKSMFSNRMVQIQCFCSASVRKGKAGRDGCTTYIWLRPECFAEAEAIQCLQRQKPFEWRRDCLYYIDVLCSELWVTAVLYLTWFV